MRTASDQLSSGATVEPATAGQAKPVARAGTGNAWISTWEFLNAPVGVVLSVAIVLIAMGTLLITQLNRLEDELKGQIGRLEVHIGELEVQVGEIRGQVGELARQMSELARQMSEIGEDLDEMRDSNRATEQRLVAQLNELRDDIQ